MLTVLTFLLVTVQVLCSLLLIGAVLLQRSKGQGVGLAFGSGMGESLFGSQVGNVLTRTTVILGVVFLVNTTLLAVLGTRRRESSVADRIEETPAALPGRVPGAGQPLTSPGAGGAPGLGEPISGGEAPAVGEPAPAGGETAPSVRIDEPAAPPAAEPAAPPVVVDPAPAPVVEIPAPPAEPAPAPAPAP